MTESTAARVTEAHSAWLAGQYREWRNLPRRREREGPAKREGPRRGGGEGARAKVRPTEEGITRPRQSGGAGCLAQCANRKRAHGGSTGKLGAPLSRRHEGCGAEGTSDAKRCGTEIAAGCWLADAGVEPQVACHCHTQFLVTRQVVAPSVVLVHARTTTDCGELQAGFSVLASWDGC